MQINISRFFTSAGQHANANSENSFGKLGIIIINMRGTVQPNALSTCTAFHP